ncbi:MAG: ABC transporter ATP-binding protein [Gemmatimonadota bacterium]|nr:ABC transporter ATP-binding protein [Gemmatimonadota bacterium]
MSAIELRELRKSFGSFEVLKGLSLEVGRGQLFGFLGPNGAGKTTTIKILTGLLLPSDGGVRVAGFDVVEEPLEVKRRVGYVPDRSYLYEKLTGREFLEFVGHLYGLETETVRRQAEPLLERFDMIEWRDELIEAYSHGMRQKLTVTAALLHSPEIVIIDEPMVGLDPRSARTVKALLRRLVDEGRTVFLSTHTLEVAEALCDRIAIIRTGRILARGTLEELRREARHEGSLESVFLTLTEEGEDPIGLSGSEAVVPEARAS